MNKTIILLMTLTSLAHAVPPHEMIIQQVPENSDIIKQCGHQITVIQSQINTEKALHQFHRFSPVFADSSTCTVTIRTSDPCKTKDCQQKVSFTP